MYDFGKMSIRKLIAFNHNSNNLFKNIVTTLKNFGQKIKKYLGIIKHKREDLYKANTNSVLKA